MLNKIIMASFISILSLYAQAESKTVNCTRLDNADDWVISGSLGGGNLDLFDNDSHSTFGLVGVKEVFPPIYVYEEKGHPNNVIEMQAYKDGAKAVYYAKKEGRKHGIIFSCSFDK